MSSDPWAEWYETYRRRRDGSAAAEAALEAGLKRQITWMSWFIVCWTSLVCAATGVIIWLLLT